MVKARPELFHTFVGAGQVADPARNYTVAYAALVEKASLECNARVLQELNEAGPPPYKDGKGFAVQRKWANWFEGADAFLKSTLGFALENDAFRAALVGLMRQTSLPKGNIPAFSKELAETSGSSIKLGLDALEEYQKSDSPVTCGTNRLWLRYNDAQAIKYLK